jgi:hypothetical protein
MRVRTVLAMARYGVRNAAKPLTTKIEQSTLYLRTPNSSATLVITLPLPSREEPSLRHRRYRLRNDMHRRSLDGFSGHL